MLPLSTFLAAAAMVVAASAQSGVVLGPITPCNKTDEAIAPSESITLQYGRDTGVANLAVEMRHTTVVLEKIASVVSVECSAGSVSVSFSNKEAYSAALQQWTGLSDFLLVTNHLGNCDPEMQNGFYVAESVEAQEETLTLVTSTTRKAFKDVAGTMEVDFHRIPSQSPGNLTRRVELATDYSFAFEKSIDRTENLFPSVGELEVAIDEISCSAQAYVAGKIKFSFWTMSFSEASLHLDANLAARAGVSVTISANFTKELRYNSPDVVISPITIMGIISIGPSGGLGIGIDLGANARATLDAGATLSLSDVSAHLDFLDLKGSYVKGLTPTFSPYARIHGEASAWANPSIYVVLNLAINVAGKNVLSAGLQFQSSFVNQFKASVHQSIGAVPEGKPLGIEGGNSSNRTVLALPAGSGRPAETEAAVPDNKADKTDKIGKTDNITTTATATATATLVPSSKGSFNKTAIFTNLTNSQGSHGSGGLDGIGSMDSLSLPSERFAIRRDVPQIDTTDAAPLNDSSDKCAQNAIHFSSKFKLDISVTGDIGFYNFNAGSLFNKNWFLDEKCLDTQIE